MLKKFARKCTSILCSSLDLLVLCLVLSSVSAYRDDSDNIWSLDYSSPESNETDLEPRVRFMIYSNPKNLSENHELVTNEMDTFNNSSFNATAPTKILIHGFLASCNKQLFPADVIKAYLRKNKDRNIICVDWASLANPVMRIPLIKPLFYSESVFHTLFVGEQLAQFLAYLSQNNLVGNMSEVHVVGLSLGAHIAGIAGYQLQQKHKLTLGRITGLDPAGLLFRENKPLRQKLDYTDADFVDVVHTNMGRLGINDAIAHADFYPNGGRIQPSCYEEVSIIANIREQVSGQCSHQISATYFKESIARGNVRACKAESWEDFLIMNRQGGPCETSVSFGEDCPTSTRGKYYFHI